MHGYGATLTLEALWLDFDICKNKEVKLLNHISLIKVICVLVSVEELN